jgi:hypothetical protein
MKNVLITSNIKITHTTIRVYYLSKHINKHIVISFVYWQGTEARTPQEQWAHLDVRSWFLSITLLGQESETFEQVSDSRPERRGSRIPCCSRKYGNTQRLIKTCEKDIIIIIKGISAKARIWLSKQIMREILTTHETN